MVENYHQWDFFFNSWKEQASKGYMRWGVAFIEYPGLYAVRIHEDVGSDSWIQ